MDKLIYTAMTGAIGLMFRQDSVANNLANLATNGYKAEEHRLRTAQVQAQGATRATALPTRAFAVDASTHTNFQSGPTMHTGRPLDMAIQGRGWFAVQMPDGSEAYTRNGGFEVSANGILQTSTGLPVVGDGGPVTIPPEVRVAVGTDGTITAIPESGAVNAINSVGRLKLVNPPDADLVRGSDGLFRLRDGGQAPADELVRVHGEYLEGSNVNAAEQMVSMISLSRQFELQMKMLMSADANDRSAAQILAAR